MAGRLERLIQRLPNYRHRIRELVETDEKFASLTREFDAAADEEQKSGAAVNGKAEKSRKRRGAIERDIVARIESSSRLL
jgi:hypothetical protein